ncbi:hypothetical protein CY34DRAFT_799629 [Suillus luteus UH-Slu-Lm8-n1]|uniref:Uncharacterized protein n=1 Tax=Suillus luteus UH-Slu-Lm8-n1 TaxID=930992 RepID=A0A0D0BWF5_9AGAM|nr:hypothetical protein CY34DRAFT_799629 [Suillus luteus UH-Slu-Lm8-n1]
MPYAAFNLQHSPVKLLQRKLCFKKAFIFSGVTTGFSPETRSLFCQTIGLRHSGHDHWAVNELPFFSWMIP